MIQEKRDMFSLRAIENIPPADAEALPMLREYAALLPIYRGALKMPESVLRKMRRKELPFTIDALRTGVRDVAGVRVVCAYINDIYCLAEMLLKQEDVTLLRRRDYISTPKESGYRGLHLLVALPVHLSSHRETVPVEIQLRTIAMDSWAALEHELQYKNNASLPQRFADQLRMCAETASVLDCNMQSIMQQIDDWPQEESTEKK